MPKKNKFKKWEKQYLCDIIAGIVGGLIVSFFSLYFYYKVSFKFIGIVILVYSTEISLHFFGA